MSDSTVMNDSSDTDTLRQDLEQLRKDFSALSKDVKHTSRDQVQTGLDKARGSCSFITDEIESRPYVSMMTVFGIGLILGKLVSR